MVLSVDGRRTLYQIHVQALCADQLSTRFLGKLCHFVKMAILCVEQGSILYRMRTLDHFYLSRELLSTRVLLDGLYPSRGLL